MKKRIAGRWVSIGKETVWQLIPCSQCKISPAFVKRDGIFCNKCGKGKTDVGGIRTSIPAELANHFPTE